MKIMHHYFVIFILSLSFAWSIDQNGDGLDDVWQWAFRAEGALPNLDDDRDGFTNKEECLAGSDPFDAHDFFQLADFEVNTNSEGLQFRWKSLPGKQYRILRADTPITQPWGDFIKGTGNFITLDIGTDGKATITDNKESPTESSVLANLSLDGTLSESDQMFFSLSVTDIDSDQDGLSDWAEETLKPYVNISPLSTQTTAGVDDAQAVSDWYQQNSTIMPVVSLLASDRCAYESNAPHLEEDNAEITLTRTGILPISVSLFDMGIENTANTSVVCNGQCCLVVGVAGDEPAEATDYEFYDESGTLIQDDIIKFEIGELERKITVKAVKDDLYEYPETLNISAKASVDNSYTLSEVNGASLQFLDAPNSPENDIIFIGAFSQDGRATTPTNGSGFLSAKLNGSRTEMTITTSFSNLTSSQQDCHVHKSNPGSSQTPGAIIYAITEVPYNEVTDPLNGPLSSYPWDLERSAGASSSSGVGASRQVIIDSLFSQNGESPLYLNIHTVSNPAGEIWAFFTPSNGSQTAPGAPKSPAIPGSSDYPLLAGNELEREVRRFLDQATFGAREDEVTAMMESILTQRIQNPQYHRSLAFEAWIDTQTNLTQTYHMDMVLADHWQFFTFAGYFDPERNATYIHPNDGTVFNAPNRPAAWPKVDRSNPNPEKWNMSEPFPMSYDELILGTRYNNLKELSRRHNRSAAFTIYQTGKDQLRQKLGYSLQQTLLVSAVTGELEDQLLAYANYQDMLNTYCFGTYRDLLGYVNRSPMMGYWLTSLMNQREADLDGDMIPDVFADENLARETMQLFTIGLFELWEDGSLKLDDSGSPIPTYSNDDIRELAKIITGQSFGKNLNVNDETAQTDWGGVPFSDLPENEVFQNKLSQGNTTDIAYYYPMKMFSSYHDQSASKTIAGGKVISNFEGLAESSEETLNTLAEKDLDDALDWLAGKPGDGSPDFDGIHSHGNLPAFISRRLIQQLVTSNPSKDYLHRVARTFTEHEGAMIPTIKAILLDPEARVFDIHDHTFGLKKNPLESYIQLNRKLEAVSGIPIREPDFTSFPFQHLTGNFDQATNPDLYLESFSYPKEQADNLTRNFKFNQSNTLKTGSSGLSIEIQEQPTVFNWYVSDYSPGGIIASSGLQSPEMQLLTDTSVIKNINYLQTSARSYAGDIDDSALSGHNGYNLGNSTANQRIAFQVDPETSGDYDRNDRIQLPILDLTARYYPTTAIDSTEERTGMSLADEALVDALDRVLTYGLLKEKYPYNPDDNDDPNAPGDDELLKNPRECIIDALGAWGDPWHSTKGFDRRTNRTADAIWLITFTPEFIIRK